MAPPKKKTAAKKAPVKKTAAKKAKPAPKRKYTRKVVEETPVTEPEQVNAVDPDTTVNAEAPMSSHQMKLVHSEINFANAQFVTWENAPMGVRLALALWFAGRGYKTIIDGRPVDLLEKYLVGFTDKRMIGVRVDHEHLLVEFIGSRNEELLKSESVITAESVGYQITLLFDAPKSHVQDVIEQNGAVYGRIG